jgi:hypothetical protein
MNSCLSRSVRALSVRLGPENTTNSKVRCWPKESAATRSDYKTARPRTSRSGVAWHRNTKDPEPSLRDGILEKLGASDGPMTPSDKHRFFDFKKKKEMRFIAKGAQFH